MESENIWNNFVGLEEYKNLNRDEYDRFLYKYSNKKDVQDPMVSKYLLSKGLKPKYPDGKRFGICISHDVDVLYNRKMAIQNLRSGTKNLLKGNLNKSLLLYSSALKKKTIHPEFDLSQTFKHGDKYGIKSSFYFLSLTKGELDYNYNVQGLNGVFDEVISKNCEVGLHGGFNAYVDYEKIKQEKEDIERSFGEKIVGYRGHYLKFKTPTTWEILEKLDFTYDTTFGYADQIGFRNGMCHPFRPYDRKQEKFLNILEIPLMIMDATLTKYMGLTAKQQFEKCKLLIDIVEANNGVLSLLWHNNRMHGEEGEMYEAILKYISSKTAWIATGEEMSNYWKNEKYDERQIEILKELKKQ